jgi:hypothetical protein
MTSACKKELEKRERDNENMLLLMCEEVNYGGASGTPSDGGHRLRY